MDANLIANAKDPSIINSKIPHLRLLAPILWALLIFTLSHQPPHVSDQQSGFFVQLASPLTSLAGEDTAIFIIRKAAHLTLYLVLGGLMYWALLPYARRRSARKAHTPKVQTLILTVTLIAGVYAITDELHQYFIPGRSAELRDVLIDTAGALLGALLAAQLARIWQKHKRRTIIKPNAKA